MRRWITRMVRRTIATPETYGRLRGAMLYLQRLTRRPDEPDLGFLGRLPDQENELILDVGANGGQSAIALSFIRPAAKILSFEPIPVLWPELQRVRTMLGPRYDFRRYALGATTETMVLFIPVSGRLPITTRASLSETDAIRHCRELEREVGLPASIDRVEVEVRTGDGENLAPTAIKIDVEGTERAVLDGFSRTIETARPVVLLERSLSFDDCISFFDRLEYVHLTHDGAGQSEMRLDRLSARNWIAVPRERLEHFFPSGS